MKIKPKKVVATSLAMCLCVALTAYAQPKNAPKTKKTENPSKTYCDMVRSLSACREYANEVWESKNIDIEKKRAIVRTYLKKACDISINNDSHNFERQSCSVLGYEYAYGKKAPMGLFAQDLAASQIYYQAACSVDGISSPYVSSAKPSPYETRNQKDWCANLKQVTQEKVRQQGYVSSEDSAILSSPF